MSEVVLDASAVIALLEREPGHERVAAVLEGARISAVNLAEVAARLLALGLPDDRLDDVLGPLGLQVVPLDAEQAFEVARLRLPTRERGLSLGDRACLALGRTAGLPVLTADRAWLDLDLGVEVRAVR